MAKLCVNGEALTEEVGMQKGSLQGQSRNQSLGSKV
jgi:hypothetical protein